MMLKIKFKKICAMTLAAVMTISASMPYIENTSIPQVAAATVGNTSMRMWYKTPAGGERPESQFNSGEDYVAWGQQSIPIGNGIMGANIFGRTETERVLLTEESFWSGGPKTSQKDNPNNNRSSQNVRAYGNLVNQGENGARIERAREAFRADNYALGQSETQGNGGNGQGLVGPGEESGTGGYGYYLNYANIFMDFGHSNPSKYVRDLDLETAISNVNYTANGIDYAREYFASNPDNVMVIHLAASQARGLNFTLKVKPDTSSTNGPNSNNGKGRTYDVVVNNGQNLEGLAGSIDIKGTLSDNDLAFASRTVVLIDDNTGRCEYTSENHDRTDLTDNTGGELRITDASDVTIITNVGTNYEQTYPEYRRMKSSGDAFEDKNDVAQRVSDVVNQAAARGYSELKSRHIDDYKSLYDRLHLDFGGASDKATDALLSAYKSNATPQEKKYLETLLYQYGRYLLIASSRENSKLPNNLQGIWVGANNSPWHSDFHLNVNEQMNYWPAYTGNLAETARPLITYVDALRKPGRLTARVYAGISSATYTHTDGNTRALTNIDTTPWDDTEIASNADAIGNGFMAHTQNTPYGWTCPGWNVRWGWSPAAVPWIIQNCWEYYEYTKDVNYLVNEIFPMMWEECRLYVQMLDRREDSSYPGGYYYISTPAFSPEHGPITDGNAYEQELVWQLFNDALEAANIILNSDVQLGAQRYGLANKELLRTEVAKWQEIKEHLYGPIEIGADGQVKEWFIEDRLNTQKDGSAIPSSQGSGHRHLSHLLALYPGDLINVNTPEEFAAAKYSMEHRTDDSEGWSIGQRINSWARLRMGDKAYQIVNKQISQRIFNNLWDWHSGGNGGLFQIDGNFGFTAAVNEMLMQSNLGYIDPLPALPEAWADGHIDGLVARGNFELSMDWSNKHLDTMTVLSRAGGDCVIKYEGASAALVTDTKGNPIDSSKISTQGNDTLVLHTEVGEKYVLSSFTEIVGRDFQMSEVHAFRTSETDVIVEWSEVKAPEHVDVTYKVFRQIGAGNKTLVASGLTDTSFKDENADVHRGEYRYTVVLVLGGENCVTSNEAIAHDIEAAGVIPANSTRIKYDGDWESAQSGNESFKRLSNPSGDEAASLRFVGTAVTVKAPEGTGAFFVYLDGEQKSTATRGSDGVIYSVSELDPEKDHIIKLVPVGNGTVTIGSFEVIGSVEEPESITVVAPTTKLVSTEGQLQYRAEIRKAENSNADFTDVPLIWTVTDENGASTNVATISTNGLLTIHGAGTVQIKAAFAANPGIASEAVTLEIISPVQIRTERTEDSTGLRSSGKQFDYNDKISIYNSSNVRITNNEDQSNCYIWYENGHSAGSKLELKPQGYYVTFDFDSDAINVIVPYHQNFKAFDVFVDGKYYGVTERGNSDIKNSLGFSWTEDKEEVTNANKTAGENATLPENSENKHRIKLVATQNDGGRNTACLDAFEVVYTSGLPDEYRQLSELLQQISLLDKTLYTTESWAAIDTAMVEAKEKLAAISGEEADGNDAGEIFNRLSEAYNNKVNDDANLDASGMNVRIIGVEYSEASVMWNKVAGATEYRIVLDDGSDNGIAIEPVVVGANVTSYNITGLNPESNYKVKVIAVKKFDNNDEKTAESNEASFTTTGEPDFQKPERVEGRGISVTANADKSVVTFNWKDLFQDKGSSEGLRYNVYVDNNLVYNGTNTSYELHNVFKDRTYDFKVEAIDEAGNVSLGVRQNIINYSQDLLNTTVSPLGFVMGEETATTIVVTMSTRSGREYDYTLEIINAGDTGAVLGKTDEGYTIKAPNPGMVGLRLTIPECNYTEEVILYASSTGLPIDSNVEYFGLKELEKKEYEFPAGTSLSHIIGALPKTAKVLTSMSDEGIDALIEWQTSDVHYNPQVAGEQSFIITGEVNIAATGFYNPNNISNLLKVRVNVLQAPEEDIDGKTGLQIVAIPDQVYTGAAIKPSVQVYDDGQLLDGKSYTITYGKNVDAGKGEVVIKGKGNYSGREIAEFTILPKNITDDDVVIPDLGTLYNGRIQKLKPVATYNNKKLKEGIDYELFYEGEANYTLTGKYLVTVVGKGNYKGIKEVPINIVEGLQVSKLKVTNATPKTNLQYTGKAKTTKKEGTDTADELTIKVVDPKTKETLKEGTHYTVDYVNNTEVGTATAIIRGMVTHDTTDPDNHIWRGYAGEKRITFKITGVPISKAFTSSSLPAQMYYEGDDDGVNPKINLSYDGKALAVEDYSVDMANTNMNAGKCTITVTGKRGFTGTVKKTIKIVPLAVESSGVIRGQYNNGTSGENRSITIKNVADDSETLTALFSKGGAKPAIKVEFGNVKLKEGRDYTLALSGNKAPGTGTVTIKFKGNFSGSMEKSFTVVPKPLASADIADGVADKALNGKELTKWQSGLALTDSDGKKLAAGKDYDRNLTYQKVKDDSKEKALIMPNGLTEDDLETVSKVKKGDLICITSKGMGDAYTGERKTIYRITEKLISTASQSTVDQIYTGAEITISKEDITLVDKKTKQHLSSDDFEIIEGSYKNNINKGTATVMIRGTSDEYGGTAVIKFKIVSRDMKWGERLLRALFG